MMKIKALIVFLGVILFNSCASEEESLSSSDACATILCAVPQQSFKLKFLERNTETDLLFANSITQARYKLSDVSIYSTRFKKNLTFQVDSTNKTNRFLIFSTPVTDEFIITLANLPQDKLSAETQFVDKPCCHQLILTKLTLNSTTVPFTQSNPTTIILKK